MKISVFVLVTVAFALAIVSCDIVEEPSVKPPGDPTSDLEASPTAKSTVKPGRGSRSKSNRNLIADKGWKGKPPSSLARRPRREIQYLRGYHGGHHGGGHHGGYHGGHRGGGWGRHGGRHHHHRIGFGGGILGGLFGRPAYRCRFVDRWGRCLDRNPFYGR